MLSSPLTPRSGPEGPLRPVGSSPEESREMEWSEKIGTVWRTENETVIHSISPPYVSLHSLITVGRSDDP